MAGSELSFVTGATGFIGLRLVRALVERGERVRALVRRFRGAFLPHCDIDGHHPLEHPAVELAAGDITEPDSLSHAMRGCSQVYHLAGYAKNWAPDPTVYYKVNVQGLLNVLKAAKQTGVKRIVWTSTQLTCGPTLPGELATEETLPADGSYWTDYQRSKRQAELLAVEAAQRENAPVVIVCPTRVYGPGNLSESNSATRLIDLYDRGRFPFLPNLGRNIGNWVFIDDVVRGLLSAMEKGRCGEKYILGGENASLKEFCQVVGRVSGRRRFQIPLFGFSTLVFAYVQQFLADYLSVYPTITPGWARIFFADWPCTSRKAEIELGYQVTPLETGIRLTYQWLQHTRQLRSGNYAYEQRSKT